MVVDVLLLLSMFKIDACTFSATSSHGPEVGIAPSPEELEDST